MLLPYDRTFRVAPATSPVLAFARLVKWLVVAGVVAAGGVRGICGNWRVARRVGRWLVRRADQAPSCGRLSFAP